MVKMVTLIEHMNQITVGVERKSLTLSLADKIQHYVILEPIGLVPVNGLTKPRKQIVKTSVLRKISNVEYVSK